LGEGLLLLPTWDSDVRLFKKKTLPNPSREGGRG
jgi:hypothetical protein